MEDYRVTGISQYNKRFGNSKDDTNGGARKGARTGRFKCLTVAVVMLSLGKVFN